MMVRQGDLVITKVNKIPRGVVKQDHRVLAEGEATGHVHELDLGDLYEKNGTLYFRIAEGQTATLEHAEHEPVSFAEGEYMVTRQKEYTPEGWRRVAD